MWSFGRRRRHPFGVDDVYEPGVLDEWFNEFVVHINGIGRRELGGGESTIHPEDTTNSTAAANETEILECSHPVTAMYLPLISIVAGAVVLWLQRRVLTFMPVSLKLFVFGVVLGIIHRYTNRSGFGMLSQSIEQWINIDPYLMFTIFIPGLIFSDSIKIDTHTLKRVVWQCVIIAAAHLTVVTIVVGTVMYYVSPFKWDWITCLMFSSALAANDPPVVATIIEGMHLPPRLMVLMMGEANFAAPASIMLFSIFLRLRSGQILSNASIVALVANQAITSVVTGLVLGFVTYYLVASNGDRTSKRSILVQIAFLVTLGYLSFLVSERNFSSSGVIATFCASVFIAATCWPVFASRTTMKNFWLLVTFLCNSVVLVLAGLIISLNVDFAGLDFASQGVVAVFYVYAILLACRFAVMLVCYPVLSRLGYGMSHREAVLIGSANLRGSIALTTAIVAQNQLKQYEGGVLQGQQFIFVTGLIVFLSLLVNGILLKPISNALRFSQRAEVKAKLLAYVLTNFNKRAQEAYDECAPNFQPHNQAIVVQHISSLTTTEDRANEEIRESLSYPANNPRGDAAESFDSDSSKASKITFKRRNTLRQLVQRKKSVDLDKKLLFSSRELFLSALRAAYWEQIVEGVIPANSVVGRVLLYSVDFALDRLKGEGLVDYERLHLPAPEESLQEAPSYAVWAARFARILPGWVVDVIGTRMHAEVVQEWVYTASCMIEGHEQAQELLNELAGEDHRHLREIDRVLSESDAEVQRAKLFLARITQIDPDIVELVQNKKLVSALLTKQKKFVDSLRSQGILDEHNHHDFLVQIRNDFTNLKKMKLSPDRLLLSQQNFSRLRKEASKAQHRDSTGSSILNKISSGSRGKNARKANGPGVGLPEITRSDSVDSGEKITKARRFLNMEIKLHSKSGKNNFAEQESDAIDRTISGGSQGSANGGGGGGAAAAAVLLKNSNASMSSTVSSKASQGLITPKPSTGSVKASPKIGSPKRL